MRSDRRILALLMAACATVPAFAQPAVSPPPPVPPDLANISYGPHARNKLDLWKAKSSRPTPLMIVIHGGGFLRGDKDNIGLPNAFAAPMLVACLERGISVASISYRFSTDAIYPAPMEDGARAVQFLREHAPEWNLNPKAFAATGGSAGAGISLWLAFHDEMADARSADPVRRQSTRLSAVAVLNAQSTYDPRTISKIIDPTTGHHPALPQLFGVSDAELLTKASAFPLYEQSAPVTHLTGDDPPVFLVYTQSNTPLPPPDAATGIHHPRFGFFLKEKMDHLGIECVVRVKEDYDGKPANQPSIDMLEFCRRHFPK